MEPLRIRDHVLQSRLILGSGKYRDYDEMLAAWDAAGADCVTVALRRVDLEHQHEGGEDSSIHEQECQPGVSLEPAMLSLRHG